MTSPRPVWPTSDELCKQVSDAQGGVCALAFSRGKDCIGAWIQLRRYFARVVPYYMADVPGLRFVEESLRHFEDHFKTPILRYVSPDFFCLVDRCAYMTPAMADAMLGLEIYRHLTDRDVDDDVRRVAGLPADSLIAHGWRTNDSPQRALALMRKGPVDERRHWFHAVWDWGHTRLAFEVRREGCGLPVDYRLFGRSFEGIRHAMAAPLRAAYPDDYERLRLFFPLLEADTFRRSIR